MESWYLQRNGQGRGAPISGSCATNPITVWCHCTVAPQPAHPPEKCSRELSRTGLPTSSASTTAAQFPQSADIKVDSVCCRRRRSLSICHKCYGSMNSSRLTRPFRRSGLFLKDQANRNAARGLIARLLLLAPQLSRETPPWTHHQLSGELVAAVSESRRG